MKLIYRPGDKPTPQKTIVFALQQLLAIMAATIAVPTIIVALLFGAKAIFGGLFHSHMILSFFVAFAMPTAGLASTFADRYSGDTEAAVTFTLGSTLFSIVTIPALYYLISLLL